MCLIQKYTEALLYLRKPWNFAIFLKHRIQHLLKTLFRFDLFEPEAEIYPFVLVILSSQKVYLHFCKKLIYCTKMVIIIEELDQYFVSAIGVQYCLHAMWHWLVQGFLVWRRDHLPNSQCDPFQTRSRCCTFTTLQDFHLQTQIFYRTQIRAIAQPSLEESYAMFRMPLFGRCGEW